MIEKKINKLQSVTLVLAEASGGNPVISTLTVMIFWLMFNVFEGILESLIFGEKFSHWLDPFFALVFISYSAYAVYWCAIINTKGD